LKATAIKLTRGLLSKVHRMSSNGTQSTASNPSMKAEAAGTSLPPPCFLALGTFAIGTEGFHDRAAPAHHR
jgi:hypothetical protein